MNQEEANNIELVERATKLLAEVKLPDYTFIVALSRAGVTLRASYMEPDIYHPTEGEHVQLTRKWVLSPHMTDSEIVSTAFKCALTSYEHRVREHFTYRGRRIFGPHFDIEDLVLLCRDRENAGGRK
jgi:hypothetical protein